MQQEYLHRLSDNLIQANTDKDKFITILAHDLRNPFTAILGFLFLLKRNLRKLTMDEIESRIDAINNATEVTYNMLEDTLLWNRAKSGKIPFEPQFLSFSDIYNDVFEGLELTASNKNIEISYTEPEPIEIFADKTMLTIIVRNLVSNALKFTPKQGKVTVFAEIINNEVVIKVLDTGVGISNAKLTKLFNSLTNSSSKGTEKEHGTGLGLLLCKEFVDKHGGSIWVESTEGKGSDFIFTIPIQKT